MEMEAPPKKSRWKYYAGIIIFAVISALLVIYYVSQAPVNIELVSEDAEYISQSRLRITVTLENTGSRECCLEVKFKTEWNGNSDTATKEVVIPSHARRTISATLDANSEYEGTTEYEVHWSEA